MNVPWWTCLWIILLGACKSEGPPAVITSTSPEQGPAYIEENKQASHIESGDIDNYIRRHRLRPRSTGSGVYHQLVRDLPGDTARPGQWAVVNFRMELLNGKVCATSAKDAPERFLIEMDDVESGLHEGIQHLSPGDSALLILASHRAYGLIGDLDQVPMRSTIVYHIGLVALEVPDR